MLEQLSVRLVSSFESPHKRKNRKMKKCSSSNWFRINTIALF